MMWLSWRQFRVQALVGAVALAVIVAYLVYVGTDVRDGYDIFQAKCHGRTDCAQATAQFRGAYENTLLFLAAGLALIPAVIGAFWGAPLIARELEANTHTLAWNQSVPRPRWLLTKVLVVGLAAMLLTGAAGAMLTWAAAPFDEVVKNQFSTFVFGARNIAPIGYAALAFTFGTLAGLLLRRTLPAMALTLVAFIAFQFFFANVVRPNIVPAEHATLPMTAEAINEAQSLGSIAGGSVINGVRIPNTPDAWIAGTSPLRTANGRTLEDGKFGDCINTPPKTGAGGTFGDAAVCLAKYDLHVDVSYQPNSRYWTFQTLETAIYLALSGVLAGVSLWRIRRRVN
ncbi:transmembrane transport protein [Amycolatopsis balhimycina DSM 5908]|uniref:Transmembrane transport protein n=1 Tax=Amycolatopsis balhimycina DSM 5908 TaxID=1081091 RepID=A0A428WN24_AMYBA|nr:ABC transporter permease subunit [Amycolatopsis balhimycina]RSM44453.1 transmembrane transport protein [Amycolatopsis balhimycina DSM 5908]